MPDLPETPLSPAAARRGAELYAEHQAVICRRTDRMFALLMALQWVVGIAAALWLSPRTWRGLESSIHVHVWAAIFVGGAISALPIALVWREPGAPINRQVIAVAQMLWSALLIHLSGGRLETHFHVFGSLAFLAFYRDWRLLVSATAVVALDHFLRGTFWPQSVFGVLTVSPWRWIEHAGWVIFEDIFLLYSIRQSVLAARMLADRQAALEETNANIESVIEQRTQELEESHRRLLEVSRRAGMAEVATSVLHNVGNVLTSVNTSVSLLAGRLGRSKSEYVGKVAAMLEEGRAELKPFLERRPNAARLPEFVQQLTGQLTAEKAAMQEEVATLARHVEHIKEIVAMQQDFARVSGVKEKVKVADLIEDAMRIQESSPSTRDCQFVRDFQEPLPEIMIEKHKALQILVNLIRNARQACEQSSQEEKKVTVRVTNGGSTVKIALTDNGVGVAPENLTRIFNYGFTTKKDGHGFGLHSGALAAKELQGSLSVSSEGLGKGATFVLELPCDQSIIQTGESQ